ncbi:response regulator [Paenibacillus sp. GCM10027626]|uniref:response regulator transcription factor n=1 Tax=Paenibacillus sp. GCM10027626 TaxID=3273411 RepID=UPI0036304BA5
MYDLMIVDDSAEIRTGLKLKLNWREYGFRVAAEAADGAQALEALQARRVSLLITDIRMPVMDGLELLQQCAIRFPEMKTIVLSGYDDFPLVQTAIRKGARDYLLKPVIKSELAAALTKLKKELDNEKERALTRIVQGKLPEAEAAALAAAYGMAEWAFDGGPVRFVTAEMRVPAARLAADQAGQGSFNEAYRLLMLEIAAQWEDHIAGFRDAGRPDRMHYLVHADRSSGCANEDELLKRFIADVRDKVNRFLQVELVLGISQPVSELAAWKSGLESSLLSLSRSKPDQVSQTIFGGEREEKEGLSHGLLRRFVVAIESADEGEALQALEEISDNGKRASMQAFSFFLLELCLAMDELIRKFDIKEIDLHLMLWPYINSAWGCDSIDQVICHLRDLALRAVSHLKRYKSKGREEAIDAIRKYILEHYGEELTLSAIAEQFHYNVAYLSDLFHKQTGKTFSDFLLEARMERASELLRDSALRIASVAELAGFSSSAYFSNVFKGYYGVGPNEYRKRFARS